MPGSGTNIVQKTVGNHCAGKYKPFTCNYRSNFPYCNQQQACQLGLNPIVVPAGMLAAGKLRLSVVFDRRAARHEIRRARHQTQAAMCRSLSILCARIRWINPSESDGTSIRGIFVRFVIKIIIRATIDLHGFRRYNFFVFSFKLNAVCNRHSGSLQYTTGVPGLQV